MEIHESTFLSNALQFWKERCFWMGSQAWTVCRTGNSNAYVKMNVKRETTYP